MELVSIIMCMSCPHHPGFSGLPPIKFPPDALHKVEVSNSGVGGTGYCMNPGVFITRGVAQLAHGSHSQYQTQSRDSYTEIRSMIVKESLMRDSCIHEAQISHPL